jgi:hypothetical protein
MRGEPGQQPEVPCFSTQMTTFLCYDRAWDALPASPVGCSCNLLPHMTCCFCSIRDVAGPNRTSDAEPTVEANAILPQRSLRDQPATSPATGTTTVYAWRRAVCPGGAESFARSTVLLPTVFQVAHVELPGETMGPPTQGRLTIDKPRSRPNGAERLCSWLALAGRISGLESHPTSATRRRAVMAGSFDAARSLGSCLALLWVAGSQSTGT